MKGKFPIYLLFPLALFLNRTVAQTTWTNQISTLSGNNYGYDVDFDNAGNLYVYGGYAPPKIAMYNSSGILQWTFQGVLNSPSWTSEGTASPNKYIGNFAVDPNNGDVYIGQPWKSSSDVQVIRLNNSGNYDSLITSNSSLWGEMWDLQYSKASGKMYVFGGGMSSNTCAAIIDTNTGILNPVTFFPANTNLGHDISCATIDDNGQIFVIYASAGFPALSNYIAKVNTAFNGTDWAQYSTYTSFSELSARVAYVNSGGITSNTFNSLTVNNNYLFYYDGFNLAAYDKLSGTKLGFITIAGNVVKAQGGIAADDCNTVYIGCDSVIKAFNFNGVSFNALTDIPLSISGLSNQYVYDIKLNKNNNLLFTCGSGFAGTYSAIHSIGCTGSGINSAISTHPVFQVYPNPTTDKLNISTTNNFFENISIELYNESGKCVYTMQEPKQNIPISISTCEKGTYFLVIKQNNKSVYSTRIFKE